MFDKLNVKQLRKIISEFRKHHNIKGYSTMKKDQLVKELDKRFTLSSDGKLYLKQDKPVVPVAPNVTQQKKRITPTLLSVPTQHAQPMASTRTKGQQRLDAVVERMEKHYGDPTLYGNQD